MSYLSQQVYSWSGPRLATAAMLLTLLFCMPWMSYAEKPGPDWDLQALERSLPAQPTDPALHSDWATLQFILRKMHHAQRAYAPSHARQELMEAHYSRAKLIRDALRQNTATPVAYGLHEEAYYCDTDGSFQPYLRYLPEAARAQNPLPLLVFLHGYSPLLDIVNWSRLDPALTAFAEKEGFLILAPFGRSNTDFQNTGELDVLRAIEAMAMRYPVDRERIILAGFSMGGMGVWTIGAHHPNAFAGLLPIAGRGDYYVWQGVSRATLPSYKRDLIDAEFGFSMRDRLKNTPVFMLHGSEDSLIPVREARHIAQAVRRINPSLIYIELEGENHWIVESAFEREDLRTWLRTRQRKAQEPPLQYNTDLLPSPIGPVKRVFLSPFIFVGAHADGQPPSRWHRAVREWEAFTKASPRKALESDLAKDERARYNIVLFGEPETSPMIRAVLKSSPVTIEKKHFKIGDITIPRDGKGLYLVRPSPWHPERLAVVQCGLHWGQGLPTNHKYDMIPDYIVYSNDRDADGSNSAIVAGFFDRHGALDPQRQYKQPHPTTENSIPAN